MPTFVSRPANTAVTGAGAVGYESGSQALSGKIAALMPKATRSISSSTMRIPGSRPSSRTAISARFTVPTAAYTAATAARKMIELSRETMT